MEPLTGWPDDVIQDIVEEVGNIVDGRYVVKFYIGRTNDLEKSKSRHGADDIVPVYKTESLDNAMDVEGTLIDIFYEHPKCDNDADHEGGGVSPEDVQYVYVALWLTK